MSAATSSAIRGRSTLYHRSGPLEGPDGWRRSRYRPHDSGNAFGRLPRFSSIHAAQGAGTTEMLMTNRPELEELDEEPCTFTIAQSQRSFVLRHVGAEPLKPCARALGPTTSRSAALNVAWMVMIHRAS